ncbi:MAG TPA: hypothetical protein VLV55_02870 [Rhizomicrobium sp.]|nr:hypothetical protein [Rhizomicrobium sp.]
MRFAYFSLSNFRTRRFVRGGNDAMNSSVEDFGCMSIDDCGLALAGGAALGFELHQPFRGAFETGEDARVALAIGCVELLRLLRFHLSELARQFVEDAHEGSVHFVGIDVVRAEAPQRARSFARARNLGHDRHTFFPWFGISVGAWVALGDLEGSEYKGKSSFRRPTLAPGAIPEMSIICKTSVTLSTAESEKNTFQAKK